MLKQSSTYSFPLDHAEIIKILLPRRLLLFLLLFLFLLLLSPRTNRKLEEKEDDLRRALRQKNREIEKLKAGENTRSSRRRGRRR